MKLPALRASIALVLALAFASAAVPVPARAVELVLWDQGGDFASAQARAKKAKKLIFIDFYATWCGPCKMMDRTVYSDSAVAREAARFVSRKVDAEKGEGLALASRYRVTAYPTMVVIDPAGNEMAREVGFRPAERFRRFLENTRTGRGTIAGLEKIIARSGDSFVNRVALGTRYVEAGQLAPAKEQYDRALVLGPGDPDGSAAELLLGIARGRSQGGDTAGALTDLDAFLAGYPSSPRRLEALEIKANAHAARAEKDPAVAAWKQILEARGASDPGALAAFARFCAANGAALDEALEAANKSVGLTGGKDAAALDAQAEVYSARGQFDEAVRSLELAVEANPSQGQLRAKLERYQEMAVAAVRAKSR